MPRSRRLLACAALALLISAAPAWAADPGWQAPIDLSPGYLYANPQIAPDAAGGFVYTWNETGPPNSLSTVHAALVPHSGSDVHVQTLDGLTFWGTALAASGNGEAIAAWEERSETCCDSLSVTLKASDEPFADPVTVPHGTGSIGPVAVAMNHHAESVIVYELGDEIWAVLGSTDGDFGDPLQVATTSDPSYYVHSVDVALADDGEAVAAWLEGNQQLRVAVGSASGFAAPATLSSPSRYASHPASAIDDAGGAVVTWGEFTASSFGGPVFASVRKPGGAFGAATQIGTSTDSADVDAAAADDGRALLTFRETLSQNHVVPVHTGTGAVGSPAATSGGGKTNVEISRSGRALLATGGLLVAWGDAGGSFGPPSFVLCQGRSVIGATIGADGDAGLLLHDYGATNETDSDDRVLLLRSDASLPPPDLSTCPAPPTTPLDQPFFGSRPRARVAQDSARVKHSGRFRVAVRSELPGQVKIAGRMRVGHKWANLRGSLKAFPQPSTRKMTLRAPKRMVERLETSKPPIGVANLRVTLRTPERDWRTHRRIHLRPAR